jgi:hypothetical protein
MEKYFKTQLKYILICISLLAVSSCNEESVIEGVASSTTSQSKISTISFNDLAIPINTKQPVEIDFGNNIKVKLDFVFILSFYTSPPANFRWAYETYIKKFSVGTSINSDDFVAGGTPYFINAIYSKGVYSYTYQNSCKVNEMGYVALQYKNPSDNTTIMGWFRFTASDKKIILHECAYTLGTVIKIGSK